MSGAKLERDVQDELQPEPPTWPPTPGDGVLDHTPAGASDAVAPVEGVSSGKGLTRIGRWSWAALRRRCWHQNSDARILVVDRLPSTTGYSVTVKPLIDQPSAVGSRSKANVSSASAYAVSGPNRYS